MKNKLHFVVVVLLTCLFLVVAAFPVSAEAVKIPINGTCTGLLFGGEDPNFPSDPRYRFWTKEDWSMMHWRNSLILFWCDYNDDRLDGYLVASDNWNTFSNEKIDFPARTFGKTYSSDENGNILNLWEGTYNAYYDQEMFYVMHWTGLGRGENQTLLAKLVFTGSEWPDYTVEGELLVSKE